MKLPLSALALGLVLHAQAAILVYETTFHTGWTEEFGGSPGAGTEIGTLSAVISTFSPDVAFLGYDFNAPFSNIYASPWWRSSPLMPTPFDRYRWTSDWLTVPGDLIVEGQTHLLKPFWFDANGSVDQLWALGVWSAPTQFDTLPDEFLDLEGVIAVPEPSTWALVAGLGLLGFAVVRRNVPIP